MTRPLGDLGHVNVVSQVPEIILSRQEPESRYVYSYTTTPVDADWHVVIDVIDELVIPNSAHRCVFVAGEPPQIRRYDPSALAVYGAVLSAPFPYLRGLANLRVATGLLPWRVGISIEQTRPEVTLTRAELEQLTFHKADKVSVVTSQKAFTRLQVKRLKLIEYLSARIPELEVYGRESLRLDDKATALMSSKYHLALENCAEPGFWTEKLSDPLLMENISFYSGHNRWEADFGQLGTVVEIEVDRPARTYVMIRRVLDQDRYTSLLPSLRHGRNTILHRLHLHAAIEEALGTLAGARIGETLADEETRVPAHRTRKQRLQQWASLGLAGEI